MCVNLYLQLNENLLTVPYESWSELASLVHKNRQENGVMYTDMVWKATEEGRLYTVQWHKKINGTTLNTVHNSCIEAWR